MPRENAKKNGVCIYDESDPENIYNLVPEKVQIAIRRVNPNWIDWTDETYRRKFKITAVDETLRLRFWFEHDLMVASGKSKMTMNNVWKGVCSRTYWEQNVLANPGKVGFIMVIPQNYQDDLNRLHRKGIKEIEGILQLDNEVRGVIAKKIEIFKYLDQRVHGGIVQKTENRNLNVTKSLPAPPAAPQTVEEIDAEIKRLEKGKYKMLPGPVNISSDGIGVEVAKPAPEAVIIDNNSPGESVE